MVIEVSFCRVDFELGRKYCMKEFLVGGLSIAACQPYDRDAEMPAVLLCTILYGYKHIIYLVINASMKT